MMAIATTSLAGKAATALLVTTCWLALGAQSAAPVAAEVSTATHIWAGTLLSVPGTTASSSQTVIVRDGRIVAVVDGYRPSPDGGRTVDLRNATVMPGLIDGHVHIISELSAQGRLNQVTKEEADWALDGVANARKTLMAGFTTVADLGAGQGGNAVFALRDHLSRGLSLGPRIVAAGSTISPTGGHADVNGFADDVLHALRRESICDGADDCRRAVRGQVRQGADVIKVTATGGVLSNTAAGVGQQFFDDELKAIAETAHSMGRRVTAHAHGTDGVNAALRAGFDSIQHGTYLDDASIRLFRETGAWLVPTVLAGVTVAEMAERGGTLTPAQRDKAAEVGPQMISMLRRARQGGVKVAFGTDSGVSRHGDNAREFTLMVEAGYSPLEAIASATVAGADYLGLSDEIGTIEPGKAADIIAVPGDPRQDISLMGQVSFVMRAGQVARSD